MHNTNKFKNKKILIWGLGINDGGLAMAEYFAQKDAILKIIDLRSEEILSKSIDKLKVFPNISYSFGTHKEEDFLWADYIVKNLAIRQNNPFLIFAKKHNKQIITETGTFFEFADREVTGVTGTKGKTTTTAMINYLFQTANLSTFSGGNNGNSIIRAVNNLSEYDQIVLELGNLHLLDMAEQKKSPHISVITNIGVDHIDMHKDFEDYINSKKLIYKFQNKSDFLIVNADNEIINSFVDEISNTKVIKVSTKNKLSNYFLDLKSEKLYENGKLLLKFPKERNVFGDHNLLNFSLAVAAVRIHNVSSENIIKAIKTFKAPKGRQEFIKTINEVDYYNDTCGTNAEAMKAMLERFKKSHKRKIILIAGGMDKLVDYSIINKLMDQNLKSLILLEGTASPKIRHTVTNNKITVFDRYNDLKEAVVKAKNIATSGDIVILCPGASSFNMFLNEFDRGEKFNNIVNNL